MIVGTAQTDITPKPGVELSGFAARTQPSTGVLDPLYAKGLYVEDGSERLLWMHADLIGVERDFVLDVRHRIEAELGLRPEHVMLSATHTHSGPATIHLQEAGTYDPAYVESLRERIIETARAAITSPQPCDVVAVESRLDLAIDRRKHSPPDTPVHVGGVGWRRADGSFAAVLINYPMHAVALGPTNRQISADIPGQAAAALTAGLPGNPIAIVTNGACGNLNPPTENVPFSQVQAWGRQVAAAVSDRFLAASPLALPALRTAASVVRLPLDALTVEQIDAYAAQALNDPASLAEWGDKYCRAVENWRRMMAAAVRENRADDRRDAELFAVRLGHVVMLGLNAEVFSEFADWVRTRAGQTIFVVGYANGDMGYIPPIPAYAEGGYEVEVAHLFYGGFRPKAGGLELLADHAVRLVRQILAS